MRSYRLLSIALAAFAASALASCAGDGGSPTGSDTSASPGNNAHPNGTQLVLASGGSQTGAPGQALPNPIVVRVLDNASNAVGGATVNFLAKDGSADPTQASTDAEGYARTTWTLGTTAGSQELRVSGTGGTTLVVGATAVGPAKVARVVVTPDSLVLTQGATGGFSAVAYDSTGSVITGRAITWMISDSTVATIASGGTVTAVSPGTAHVTATVDGVAGSATVFVVSPPPAAVARVVVTPDSVVLQPGQPIDLAATAYDAEGHVLTGRTVTWTTSDSTVATVVVSGIATAVAPGSARITATVEGVSGSAMVFVHTPPATGVARVEVTPDSVVLEPGHTADFNATAYDAEGHVLTGREIAWTISDSTVATIGAGGTVTAVAPGTARVTATVDGINGFAKVNVPAPPPPPPAAVARVAVTPDSVVLQPGQAVDLDATAYDAEGHVLTGRAVTWTTSDSTVARVGAGGLVTGGAPGSARITATVEGVSASAMVFVYGPSIVRVEVVPDSQVVVIGQTASFSAFAYDATNHIVSGLQVTWSISDANVARIGQYGLVTALAVGTARVTATVEGLKGYATVRVIEQPVGSATAPPNASPDIGAGYNYVCRLRSGIIQCYGSDDDGQPIGEHHAAAGSFVQLSAGQTHACGLRSDGVVECFGSSEFGEAPAQKRAATGSFTQVSAGMSHSCALRTDGAMECWGNNTHGEAPAVVTAQAGKFVVVTAFANRTCALRNDGAVECRGFHAPDVTVLPGGWYVRMGTAVGITVCFERNSGLGECWGPASIGYGPFEQLTAGAYQECVLHPGGTAFCAGNASSFQSADGRSVTGPDEGSIRPRTWARISAGSYHTCGLRADGYFECFGLQTIGSDAPDVVPWADTPISALSGASVRVSWRDINSNELRTEIDRSVADAYGNPTTWARAAVLSANQTGFTDAQATPGGIYVYRIRVCNNAGCSPWAQSNSTRFPAAAPPVPDSVMASGYVCGYNSCSKVTWTADVTFVDSFRVQRRAMTGSTWGEWADVWTRVDRDHTSFYDYAITPGTTYQYRVAACNVSACSAYGTSNSFVAVAVPPPAAPGDLVASMENDHMMWIAWGDVAYETGYELQRREYDGTSWGAWSEPVGRAMNDTHDEQYVTAGVLYQWRIRACNQGGCSAYTSSEPTRATW